MSSSAWDRGSGGVMERFIGDVSSGGSCGTEERFPSPSSNHAMSYIGVDQILGCVRMWATHSAIIATK